MEGEGRNGELSLYRFIRLPLEVVDDGGIVLVMIMMMTVDVPASLRRTNRPSVDPKKAFDTGI